MRDYTIFTDSTCDLTPAMYRENGLKVFMMTFSIDDVDYPDDGVTLAGHDFYQKMREGAMPTTAQLNPDFFFTQFAHEIEAGHDVIYLGFASACSGMYQSSLIAVSEVREKYPDARVYTIDSTSECGGEGRLALAMAQKKREGLTIDQLYEWTEENKKYFIHLFTVDDLNHLFRGGRLTRTAAIAGTVLGIKPAMYTALDGKLTVGSKVRGRRASLQIMCDRMFENIIEPERQVIIINHADCPGDARWMVDYINAHVQVGKIHVLPMGPIIGTHCGPGCIALFFTGKTREWHS
ncbi:MAG: DegV family protein [Clostridiaceae bacterium]|nr:DegV family protein [Clostridiaceae bacterium]